MALTLRRSKSPSKLQRARGIITTLVALRTLGVRKVATVFGVGAVAVIGLAAAKRARGKQAEPVPGAAPTEASAPTPPQNGTNLQDPAEQARAAAASLAPHGSGAA
ncbi:MAG: hypothetical protein JHC84_01155 [Solirubrobacteraceae bacterium]|nr:hypothetical protein [Solirubrobacteraceae bacterium]